MISVLLPTDIVSRFTIAQSQFDIEKHICRFAIPKRYGGEREDINIINTANLKENKVDVKQV